MIRGVCQPDNNSIGNLTTPRNKFAGMSKGAIALAIADGHSPDGSGIRQPCHDVCMEVYDNQMNCGMAFSNCTNIGSNCNCQDHSGQWTGFNWQVFNDCVEYIEENCDPDDYYWGCGVAMAGCATSAQGTWDQTWCTCSYVGPSFQECLFMCSHSGVGSSGYPPGTGGHMPSAAPPGWRKGGRITKKPIRRKKIRRRR